MLIVPLLSAGSRLQPCFNSVSWSDDRMQFHRTPLTDSIVAAQINRAVDDHWRHFVQGRIGQIQRIVNHESVRQGARLMETLWEIADAHKQPVVCQSRRPMYWMDVMSEKRLETLLG